MTKDLTVGNPIKIILLFSIPLMIGNIFQQVYSLADAIILGNVIGVHALAAVGSTGSITFLIFGYIMGACNGLGMITAQKFGAGDEKGVRRSVASSYIVAVVIAIALTLVSAPFTRGILSLMQTPAEIIDDAYIYLFILLLGNIIVMMFNLLASIMRAVGDSKTPLYFLIIAVGLNIALVFLFILVFNWGVAGAAAATIIGQLASVAMCMVYIRKKFPILKLTKEDWKVNRRDLQEHFRMAIPMGFSISVIAVGTIVVQYVLNGFGPVAIAGFTTAIRIEQIGVMPFFSLSLAVGTYVAQNYGAGKIDRIKKGVASCVLWGVIFSAVVGIIFFFAGFTMAGWFVGGDAKEVQTYAQTFLRIHGVMYFTLILLMIYRFALQGLGKSFAPFVGSIAELVMRIFSALVLGHFMGFWGIILSNPLAWIGAVIPLGILYYISIRQLN